jgi:hypothetical protein
MMILILAIVLSIHIPPCLSMLLLVFIHASRMLLFLSINMDIIILIGGGAAAGGGANVKHHEA